MTDWCSSSWSHSMSCTKNCWRSLGQCCSLLSMGLQGTRPGSCGGTEGDDSCIWNLGTERTPLVAKLDLPLALRRPQWCNISGRAACLTTTCSSRIRRLQHLRRKRTACSAGMCSLRTAPHRKPGRKSHKNRLCSTRCRWQGHSKTTHLSRSLQHRYRPNTHTGSFQRCREFWRTVPWCKVGSLQLQLLRGQPEAEACALIKFFL